MSGEVISHDLTPPACKFFRDVIADSHLTDHDLGLVAAHTKTCRDCEDVIGRMIYQKIEADKQAEASGA